MQCNAGFSSSAHLTREWVSSHSIPDNGPGFLEAKLVGPFLQVQCGGIVQGQDASLQRSMKPAALTVRECCASLNFWLLFTVFGVGTGIGLMFVNNLGMCPTAALQLTCADVHEDSIA